MADEEYWIQIRADLAKLKEDLSNVNNELSKFREKQEKGFKKSFNIGEIIKKSIGVISGIYVLRKITDFFKESIQEAADYELQLRKIQTGLEAAGVGGEFMARSLAEYADALQETTIFSNTEIMSAMSMLATFKLTEKQIKEATRATLDLAAATGQDLQSAAILMGKAMVGVTGMLSRYGIIIDKAKVKSEGYRAVLEEINKEFGGQAQKQLETYAGKVRSLRNSWADFKRTIGEQVIPALKKLVDALNDSIKFAIGGEEIKDRILLGYKQAQLEIMKENKRKAEEHPSLWNKLFGVSPEEYNKMIEDQIKEIDKLEKKIKDEEKSREEDNREIEKMQRSLNAFNQTPAPKWVMPEDVKNQLDYFKAHFTGDELAESIAKARQEFEDYREWITENIKDFETQKKLIEESYQLEEEYINRIKEEYKEKTEEEKTGLDEVKEKVKEVGEEMEAVWTKATLVGPNTPTIRELTGLYTKNFIEKTVNLKLEIEGKNVKGLSQEDADKIVHSALNYATAKRLI